MFSRQEIASAAALVARGTQPSPQIAWPLLAERTGAEVVVKHENHLPTGAFKVRGALTFFDWLARTAPGSPGIITATRGNHGQAQALAAARFGKRAVVYVPYGNAREKNAAMRAYGAELHEIGADYDETRDAARRAADAEGLSFVPPFHRELVRGVSTCGFELLSACPDLDTVYVPIGCGSGICGMIAARDALGLATEIVGVVPETAASAKLSFDAGRPIETSSAITFADGTAVRVPVPEALAVYSVGAERIVAVSDDEIAEAIRIYYSDTHNLAEGAGAEPLAALMKERAEMAGRRVGLVLSGGNIDAHWMAQILSGRTPRP